MGDSLVVGRVKPTGDPDGEPCHGLERQWPLAQELRQRLAFHEIHREIGAAERRIDREDEVPDDGFVMQVVEARRLVAEQGPHQLVLGELVADDLDRHAMPGLDGMALVDLAHAAARDEAVDLVDPVELRARSERVELRRVRHRCPFRYDGASLFA